MPLGQWKHTCCPDLDVNHQREESIFPWGNPELQGGAPCPGPGPGEGPFSLCSPPITTEQQTAPQLSSLLGAELIEAESLSLHHFSSSKSKPTTVL